MMKIKNLLLFLLFILIAFNTPAQSNYSWGKSIGGFGDELQNFIATDADSNVYIAGTFCRKVQRSNLAEEE